MWVSQTYMKKTRKGNVQKVVREHYLRDDIYCGSGICQLCSGKPKLDKKPGLQSSICNFPHYLIVDTNVILHQIDVIEDPALKNVIILQTVLNEVRRIHQPIYKRLSDLLRCDERKFYFFVNEHHQETYIKREKGETANDRNDRAIRKATKWYCDHLKLSQKGKAASKLVRAVLLTNDKGNLKKAKNDGLTVCQFSDYVSSLKSHEHLLDKLSAKHNEIIADNTKKSIYPIHLPISKIHIGIKKGKYLQGTFQVSRENYLEGFVLVENRDENILIQGRTNQNRAIHNYVVAVELLPESEWTTPSSIVLDDEVKDEEIEDNEIEIKPPTVKKQPTGKIVGIIKPQFKYYCGILNPSPIKDTTFHLVIPSDKRIPRIKIETKQAKVLSNQRILVAIDHWHRQDRYPRGHLVKQLGEIGNKDTENEVLLLEHEIPYAAFPKVVLECLPELPWKITENDMKNRRDFRHVNIFSVDPPGCTDIDDALHCKKLDNGNYEVGVHIADVSYLVRPNSALDKEAATRGTTVYLMDKRIDMIPGLLSSGLCSLKENEDRLAFSCVWEMTSKADVKNVAFTKSAIKSRAALTYAEAQIAIDDKTRNDVVALDLRNLNKLAKLLKQKRLDNGALVLASNEVRFNFDSETCEPIDVESKQLRDTNSMIEEFMLLANISVAEKIFEFFPECALLRRHPQPSPGDLDPVIKAGKAQGFNICVDDGKSLSESLDKAVIPESPYFNTMLRLLTTRCMTQATYFCSGNEEKCNFCHFGLATPIYTHFTSPIRRYADLVVHRLLAIAVGADVTYPDLIDTKKSQNLCVNLNYRHKMAQHAGRASVNLNTYIYFKNRETEEEGYVLFVRQNALQILIPRYGLEIPLFVRKKYGKGKLETVEAVYNDEEPSQTINGVKIKLFQRVVVKIFVNSTDVQRQKLQIELIEPEIPGFSVPKTDKNDDDDSAPPAKRKRHS